MESLENYKQYLENLFTCSDKETKQYQLTDNLLKALSEEIDNSLYATEVYSDDHARSGSSLELKMLNYQMEFMRKNKTYRRYYTDLKSEGVKVGVFNFTKILYLIHHHKIFLKLVNEEFFLCARILSSDLCIRNLKLSQQICLEFRKLDAARNTNPVRLAVNKLYDIFKNAYPKKSKLDLCIDVSTAMNALKIYDRKPFLTKKEAEDWVDIQTNRMNGNYFQTADKVIYDRVKKFLYKSIVKKGK